MTDITVPALLAQIAVLHRALMRRVQKDNECAETGEDCNVRGGGMLCSCSLEIGGELSSVSHPLKAAMVISGVRQATNFDGTLLRAGGPGAYASILMQDLSGDTVSGFAAQRSLAQAMAPLLYRPIRVHGVGSWDRSPEGKWSLTKMLVQTYELLEDESLPDVVKRLQALSVIWPQDADAKLKAEREQV